MPEGALVGLARTLPADPRAAATARRSLLALRDVLPPQQFEDVRLVVSELVTNAVLHSGLALGDWIHLTVDLLQGHVRVEVTDGGWGFTGAPARSEEAFQQRAHGYGLLLVERLADRWGVERGPETTVWAEIPPGGPEPRWSKLRGQKRLTS